MAQTQTNATEQLRQLVDQWTAALVKGDEDTLRHMIADTFITIGPRGFVLDKEQWLAGFKPGNLTYESLDWSEVSVTTIGDTAFVIGRDQQKVKYQDNAPMEMDLRALLVFVRQQDRWRLASQQYSPIIANAPAQ